MPPRKDKRDKRETTTVSIDRDAHKALQALHQTVMRFDLPRYIDQMEVVSALAMFTTPEQLHGMLLAYWRHINKLASDAVSAPEETPEGE